MSPTRVMIVYGTRPEAVKVAPVIKELEAHATLEPIVVSTGQHREMLEQVNALFSITPDRDLKLFKQGQTLNELSSRIFTEMDGVLAELTPDAVMVQGDTTTVAMGALASFYRSVPVVHLEAGLRSGNIRSPFPEEANRRVTGQVTDLHLAPTTTARDNLLREGVDPATITVTGNTVIDALQTVSEMDVTFTDARLEEARSTGRPVILVTSHRRENWGDPMRRIAEALAQLAERFPEHLIVLPMHGNPAVREVFTGRLGEVSNVALIDALDYLQFTHAQKLATVVLTDSGGVQEESPSLGKPVLVMRENTERPEAVEAGTVRLVGSDTDRIVAETSLLLTDEAAYRGMSQVVNPYGDGLAAKRSVAAIGALLGVGSRMPDFSAGSTIQ